MTAAIRADRQQAGELGEAVRMDRLEPAHYTAAQKTDPRNLHVGHVLVFHKATSGIQRHEALEVVQVTRDHVVTRREGGALRQVSGALSAAFDVCDRHPIEIAPHDRLLLMANRRAKGCTVTNGELVTVSRVDQHGRLQLEDGRTLPASYQQFDYGYAVTAHRSQGQSVDAVVIAAETMKQELFYAAASRGRERVTVVTSDKARLQESIAQSGARQSASDLARQAAVVEYGWFQDGSGVERGRQMAVALAHQAARHGEMPKREPLEHTQQSQFARTVVPRATSTAAAVKPRD